MKKNGLKLTATLFALILVAVGSIACSVFDESDNPASEVTKTTAVLSLAVAEDTAGRTALPAVSSVQTFDSFAFQAVSGTNTITKSWTADESRSAYERMTGDTITIDTGAWAFTLTAKKGGAVYAGSCKKEIIAGKNSISFALSLASMAGTGVGSIQIRMTVPDSVQAVSAALYDAEEAPVLDATVTEDCTLAENAITYGAQNVPSGTYVVLFNLYADAEKTLLLGTWREYAGVTDGITSAADISIAQGDLETVYTITYVLNGGTLQGNWSGSYTRYNLVLPSISDILKNGYVFKGWYADETYTQALDVLSTVGDVTAYAKWARYTADEAIAAINNGSTDETWILEGEMTSEKLSALVAAITEKQCPVMLDLSATTGLTAIDMECKGCTYLTGIAIPDTVTLIEKGAFSGCSGLTEMTIPFVGGSATATEASASTVFGYIFGDIEYTGGTATKMCYASDSKYISYYIPSSLRAVTVTGGCLKYGAFYGCSGLTNLTIPDSVTSIGDYAFRFCGRLTNLTIPDSVTSIGDYAFEGCGGLTNLTMIPDSVTSIGVMAFHGCSGLTNVTIPNGVTSIGSLAFYECRGLTSVTIPDSVTNIDDSAFKDCTGLTSVIINGADFMGPYMFTGCSKLASVTIGNSVKYIGYMAFYKCEELTSVTIGNGVEYIGLSAFESCGGLTSVTIPGCVTSIGHRMFVSCKGLRSVTIDNGVERIGMAAFVGCSYLPSIAIPNSVTYIEDSAFGECYYLKTITFSGTIAQWNAITKEYGWNRNVPATKVICTDGEVNL